MYIIRLQRGEEKRNSFMEKINYRGIVSLKNLMGKDEQKALLPLNTILMTVL